CCDKPVLPGPRPGLEACKALAAGALQGGEPLYLYTGSLQRKKTQEQETCLVLPWVLASLLMPERL
uniref:Uncharacterized protein n=1 Tax=Aegilops tauschii subsp. strangulata TaxID=200361 RepID=A0A452ZKX7_AEGTS